MRIINLSSLSKPLQVAVKAALQETSALNGTKVVDKSGNPLKVYHGSPKHFEKFSSDYLGTNGRAEGLGFYFTSNKEVAEGYTEGKGKLFEVFLDIKKPLQDTRKVLKKPELKKFIKALDPTGENYLSNWGDVSYEGYQAVLEAAVEGELSGSDNDLDIIHSIFNVASTTFDEFFKLLHMQLGYDGTIIREASWGDQSIYIVYSPEQIYPATGTTKASTRTIRLFRGLEQKT